MGEDRVDWVKDRITDTRAADRRHLVTVHQKHHASLDRQLGRYRKERATAYARRWPRQWHARNRSWITVLWSSLVGHLRLHGVSGREWNPGNVNRPVRDVDTAAAYHRMLHATDPGPTPNPG